MKNQAILILTALIVSLDSGEIILTKKEEKNWQISVAKPQIGEYLPLGDFVADIVTPPNLLHTVSLPFEANIKKLYVAQYQMVKKGEILAKVTGTKWISIQQQAIAQAIEYKHHTLLAKRKNILCKEEIIPKKECISADAELKADKIKVSASKALLKSYGASKEMIDSLFSKLTLFDSLDIKSKVQGRIVKLNAATGKNTALGEALFVIQSQGNLWLESQIEAKRVKSLKENQTVYISINDVDFKSKILHISPVINPTNQTRQVRFHVPNGVEIVSGLRGTAHISVAKKSIKIPKNALIKDGSRQIVFIKTKNGYKSKTVNIIAEDNQVYFIKMDSEILAPIATSSLAVLKNMLGERDE